MRKPENYELLSSFLLERHIFNPPHLVESGLPNKQIEKIGEPGPSGLQQIVKDKQYVTKSLSKNVLNTKRPVSMDEEEEMVDNPIEIELPNIKKTKKIKLRPITKTRFWKITCK